MYQKIKRIIVRILVISVIIGALLYFIPWPSRVNLSLNAAKLDANGNVVGSTVITIKGVRLDYLLRDDLLQVNIYPFDNINWIQLSKYNGKEGVIVRHHGDTKKLYCSYSKIGRNPSFCNLLFTEDFKYVAMVLEESDTKTYYVASENDEVPTEELVAYFRYLPPFG